MFRKPSFTILVMGLIIACSPVRADDKADCDNYPKESPDAAIAACGRLIASGSISGSELASAYENRGRAWAFKNNLDRAIEDYGAAIRIDPNRIGAFYSRGYQWTRKNDYRHAISDYSEAIKLNSRHGLALTRRGEAYEKIGEFIKAFADYQAALDIDPKQSIAAEGFRRVNPKVPANSPVRQASKPPDDQNGCERYQSNPDLALAACGRLIESGVYKSDVLAKFHNNRGSAYAFKDDIDKAIVEYSEAARIDPNNIGAYAARGFQWSRKGDYRRAIADYSEAIRLLPRHGLALQRRAEAYEKLGDYSQALADFKTALAISPNDSDYKEGVRRTEQKVAAGPASARAPQAAVATAARPSPPPVSLPSTGTRVALVIGNGAYVHVAPLPNPPNDARDVAAALRELGFKVIDGFDLDSAGMRRKVSEFGNAITNAQTALLFYAGHGMQVDGKNYLIPIDAKLERPSSLSTEAIDVSVILSDMETERRTNLVFLDACRDNPMARTLARSFGASRSTAVGQGLAQINAGIGTMIAFSTSPNNVALDGSDRNSPFTRALLNYIRTPGLEISEMMRNVRVEVIKQTNEKQVPWEHTSLTGKFYFRPVN